jgi:prepilin-type N-terminal cleavage/methylation domain-containing protein
VSGRLFGRRRAGFTLLEVLVAVAVLGVALVTLLGLQARNLRLAAQTRDLTVAGLLAKSLAATTKAGPFPESGTLSGDFTDETDSMAGLDEHFGGAQGAERFAWKRTVEWLGFKNVRGVHIEVGLIGEEAPLATVDFLVRRDGP